ncbi:hypothetical protein [Halobaculum sp. MBLA0143]|uniref:hypothetical protein n=1 Tax=Halobaculum sp. MBLA0143 TaxID=3079933 RepID=UPI0035266BED
MKRRALLSAVAVGGLAGCLTERRPATIVGIPRRRVEIVYCGEVIGRPCRSIDGIEYPSEVPSDVSGRLDGTSGAERREDRILIRGATTGIGDPDCRETRVSRIELRDDTLRVTIRNGIDLGPGGCEENASTVQYLVTVLTGGEHEIERVHVEHYSHRDEVQLSGTVSI